MCTEHRLNLNQPAWNATIKGVRANCSSIASAPLRLCGSTISPAMLRKLTRRRSNRKAIRSALPLMPSVVSVTM